MTWRAGSAWAAIRYARADLDAGIVTKPGGRYVMHVHDGTVVTITYRNLSGVNAASAERPETVYRALLGYEHVDRG